MPDIRSFVGFDVKVSRAQDINALRQNVRALRQELDKINANKAGAFGKMAQGMAAYARETRLARAEQSKWFQAQQRAKTGLMQEKQATEQLRQAQIKQRMALAATRAEMDRTRQSMMRYRDGLFRIRSAAMDLRYTIGGTTRGLVFSLIGLGWAFKNISSKIATGAADIQNYRNQLSTLLGGPTAGGRAMKEIRAFALESPLTLKETIQSTIRLLNFGHEYNDILRERTGLMETMVKASVFANKPLQQTVEALEKIRSGMLLQRQLTPIGITPSFFKDVMGLEMQKGKPNRPVLADTDPQKLYDLVIKALEKKFADFDPGKLLWVKLSNIIDRWDVFWQELGDKMAPGIGKVLDRYKEFIDKLIDLTGSSGLSRGLSELFDRQLQPMFEGLMHQIEGIVRRMATDPDALTNAVKLAADAFRGMLTAIAAGGLLTGLATFTQLLGSLALAFTNPASGILAAVALLVSAGMLPLLHKFIQNLLDPLAEAGRAFNDLAASSGTTNGVLNNVGVTMDEVRAATYLLTEGIKAQTEAIQSNVSWWNKHFGNTERYQQFRVREPFRKLGVQEMEKDINTRVPLKVGGSTLEVTYGEFLRLMDNPTLAGQITFDDQPLVGWGAKANDMTFEEALGRYRARQELTWGGAVRDDALTQSRAFGRPGRPNPWAQYGDAALGGETAGEAAEPWLFAPLREMNLTSGFNAKRRGGLHGGEDYGAKAGTPVHAVSDALVLQTGYSKSDGLYWIVYLLEDPDGNFYQVFNFHVNKPKVQAGDRVKAGDVLATVGKDHLDMKVVDLSKYPGQNPTEVRWKAGKGSLSPWRAGETVPFSSLGEYKPYGLGEVGAELIPPATEESRLGTGRFQVGRVIGMAKQALEESWKIEEQAAEDRKKYYENWAKFNEQLLEVKQREYDIRQAVVDALEAIRDRLQTLVGGLVAARGNLLVAMHEALGFDKGADRQRSINMMDSIGRASAARDKIRAGRGRWAGDDYYERESEASIDLAQSVTTALEFAAGLRDKEGAEDIYSQLMDFLKPFMQDLPNELQTSAEIMQERLTEAGDRLIAAAAALQNAAIILARGELTPQDLAAVDTTAAGIASGVRGGAGSLRRPGGGGVGFFGRGAGGWAAARGKLQGTMAIGLAGPPDCGPGG